MLTHLSWAGSPLLDAGDNNRALDQAGVPLAYDQRGAGFGRILNTTVDIGAVEGSRAVAFALTGPVGSYYIGQTVPITWDPAGVPVNSKISLYYDADATINGNEVWIVQDLTVPGSGVYSWLPPLTLGAGNYYVGGLVRAPDGTQYASRLAGPIGMTIGGTTYIVTTDKDIVAADGVVSLREAVQAANINAAVGDAPAGSATYADLIQFAPSLSGGTIVLNGSQLSITDDLVITGPGQGLLTVNGDTKSRVFAVTDPTPGNGDDVRVGIAGMSIAFGKSGDDGGGVSNGSVLFLAGVNVHDNSAFDDGGGVFNASGSSLTITDSVVSQNISQGSSSPTGAGICNQGDARLAGVTVTLNVAYGDGGGIYTAAGVFEATGLAISLNTSYQSAGGLYVGGGVPKITDSVLSRNIGYTNAGGIRIAAGNVVITGTTIDDNTVVSGNGGGINNGSTGTVMLTNCIVSGNSTSNSGGGIYDSGTGTLFIQNTQVTGNRTTGTSGAGGGIWNKDGAVQLLGSVVSDNAAATKGGGIYNYNTTTLVIEDSQVTGNRLSATDAYGGGIYSYYAALTIRRSRISGNVISASGTAYGGGIYAISGTRWLEDTTVLDNEVSGGTNGYGGGIYFTVSDTQTILRSTLSGNSVYGASTSQGGGMYAECYYNDLNVIDSTISGNRAFGSASASGGGLYAPGSTA